MTAPSCILYGSVGVSGSPDFPLKVAALAQPTLRRLPPSDNLRLSRHQCFQLSEKVWDLFVSLNFMETFLGYQQARPHPAFSLITAVPTFHVHANALDDGEGRLDHIRAGECVPQ